MAEMMHNLPLLQGRKLLIFDFDGTIADTSPLHAAAFNSVLQSMGVAVDYPSVAGMRTAEAILRCAADSGVILNTDELNQLVTAKQSLVREMMRLQLQPLPGVDRFLRWARQHFQLSMATSGSRGTVSLALELLGYETWFDPVVCAEDVEHAKPSPLIFEKVLSLKNCKPNQALVFEDSEAGVEAARAAGIESIRIQEDSWLEFQRASDE